MTNKEFIATLAQRTGCTSREANNRVRTLIKAMTEQLTEGNQINVPSFGTFEVKKKNERISVHPTTGQRMLVPPKLVLGFKPSTTLKELFQL